MKRTILRVVQAEIRPPFGMWLAFNDGTRKLVDLSSELDGTVFLPLREPDFFARGVLDTTCGTVVWPNGADFAPEALYALASVDQPASR